MLKNDMFLMVLKLGGAFKMVPASLGLNDNTKSKSQPLDKESLESTTAPLASKTS